MATAVNETNQTQSNACTNDTTELEKWSARLETRHFFKGLFNCIDESDSSYKHLCEYSNLMWLPKKNSKSCYKETETTLKMFLNENTEITRNWNLMDNDGYYKRFSKDKNYIYIDVVWKRSWFSEMNLNVPKKVYFWRATYCNNDWGKQNCGYHGSIMVQRLNLCYVAWRKCVSRMSSAVSISRVPIIVFTQKIPGIEGKSKWPQWIFIECFNKKNVVQQMIGDNQGSNDNNNTLRRSARLAANEKEKSKTS